MNSKILIAILLVQTISIALGQIVYTHQSNNPFVFVNKVEYTNTYETRPVTIELKNTRCFARACDYGIRYGEIENMFFVYSPNVVTVPKSTCRAGRDFVIKRIDVACDYNFCINHGIGIVATRSCGNQYCECSNNGVAVLKTCRTGTVFHPQYLTCDIEPRVYSCMLLRNRK